MKCAYIARNYTLLSKKLAEVPSVAVLEHKVFPPLEFEVSEQGDYIPVLASP